MSIDKKNKIKVLKFELLSNEYQTVLSENQDGEADLMYRLSHFRKKLANDNINQVSKFDSIFFSKIQKENLKQDYPIVSATNSSKEEKTQKKEKWFKDLYKKIVMITHPDVSSKIPIDTISNQFLDYYRTAVKAYKDNIYADIILIAVKLDISVNVNLLIKHLDPAIERKKRNVAEIKKLIGYRWYNVLETEKNKLLKQQLVELGFFFTDDLVEEVLSMKRKSKRRPGKRPVNLRSKRLK
jgi:hypothetical protein